MGFAALYPSCELIGYDNERGKGDHRHYGDEESPYRFTTAERLLADFHADVEREETRQCSNDS